jgi:LuxR family transcriptional regulator, maltose regulon positive regulatory protein
MLSPQPQLLATKVLRPRSAMGVIERPQLLDLVGQVQAKQLTIIKAGAGFGKTSLAVRWAEQLQQGGNLVAWLALDAEDNEPTRFLLYLSHALRGASDDLGEEAIELIRDASLNLPRTIVSTVINDLTNIDDDIFLFLDDAHWLTHPEIQNAISFMLRRAPSNLHLVLITRLEPHFSLTTLRAQNQLLEIGVAMLRFSLDETRRFLEQEGIGELKASDVRVVHAKTEGWPAVLRIIASTVSRSVAEFEQFASRLSGAARPISAYFDEMLDGLPSVMVQFMLRTAILDRFTASLCQAVTGVEESDDLLESIERRQLLLASLDQERQWYRYHPLLAGYLGQRLKRQCGDEIPELRRRAAYWFAAHEMWTEAVQYAISADNTAQAASWIENCAMALVKRGDMLTLLSWERILPAELMRKQIKVRLAIAWGLALAMRFEEALRLVTEIEHDVRTEQKSALDALTSECLAIRSVAVALQDDSHKALMLAKSCLSRNPTDPWTANVASNVARFGYWRGGELKSFYSTPWIPYSLEEDKWNVFASVYRLCLQGLVELDQLRLHVADERYQEAKRLAEQHVGPSSVAAALPASLIAYEYYEQGRLEEAENMVLDRLPIINAAGMLECAGSAYFALAKIAASRRNMQRAFALLGQAENLGHERKWGRLSAMAHFLRLQFYLAERRVSEAGGCLESLERLAAEYAAPTMCAWSAIHFFTAFARAGLASADNRFEESISILKAVHREAEMVGRHYHAYLVAVQLSITLLNANEPVEASDTFCEIVRTAESAGFYQTILDGGPQIGKLISAFQRDVQHTGKSREFLPYVDGLIAGWRGRYEPKLTPDVKPSIAELLSARERSIIELIARGQSNKEVARDLGISPETVKSHVKHIFAKLDVDKRTRAVVRARSLGLVSTQ